MGKYAAKKLLLFCQLCATIQSGNNHHTKKEHHMEISERELTQFLEAAQTEELATWRRQRTSEELHRFVARKLEEAGGEL